MRFTITIERINDAGETDRAVTIVAESKLLIDRAIEEWVLEEVDKTAEVTE